MLNPDIFQRDLQPIDRAVATTIPPALGFHLMSGVVLMPYGVEKSDAYHGVVLGFDWRSQNDVRIPLGARLLRGLFDGPVDDPASEEAVGVSFRYYKALAGTEIPEPGFRDLSVAIGSTCFSFGVLPGKEHAGEQPTWYLGGLHLGHSALDENGHLRVSEHTARPQTKNFSMARVINGPVGSPLNPYFRQAMGIQQQYPDPSPEN